jgi:long-chain fatty acid transport protein
VARTSRARVAAIALVVAAGVLSSSVAWAGGMFLPVRGARALGRGGAFTAGVDDASALYQNPAGMADIDGISVFGDGALDLQRVGYDRVDSGGNAQPHVDGQMNVLPLPTLAVTWKPRRARWLTVGAGIWVPYLGINSWPETGPQRYSNITLNGSLLAVIELAAAFRIRDWLWVGFGLQNMVLHFHSRVMLSACSQLNCAPEDPSFDALTQLDTDAPFTPSGNVGAIVALQKLRIGVNVQLPFWVRSSGSVVSRLPTDPFFANAALHNSAVTVDFNLPLELRAGVEYRPLKTLRLEVDFNFQAWSMQDRFTVQPKGIYISGVPGIGNFYLNTMYVNRDMQNTFAVHVGGEYEAMKHRLWARLGWILETSGTPDATASVLTPDAMHNLLCFGLGVRVWREVRADLGYAHAFFDDRTVNYKASQSFQLNPIQPALAVPVGGGHYSIAADILAAGLDARF